MAALCRSSSFVPALVQCRMRHKFHTKKPRPRPLIRRVFEAVTRPVLPLQVHDPTRTCGYLKRKAQEETSSEERNLYEEFLIQQCQNMFDEFSAIIAFQVMSASRYEFKVIKNVMLREDIQTRYFSNEIMRKTTEGSRVQNMMPLFRGKNLYFACKTEKLPQLVKLSKKQPQILMLGGLVEDRILTREGLLRVAALPPLDVLRGEMLSILNSAARKTHSLLGSHQQTLSTNLTQYVKDQTVTKDSS